MAATPWKKRCKIPDMQILDVAEQYDDACQLLKKQPPGLGVLQPQLNTAAVAVELFLKSLSSKSIFVPLDNSDGYRVYAEPELKHHKLVELFDGIPEDIRNELESRFSTSTLTSLASSLREMLRKYEGLFAISRYPFEKNSGIRNYPPTPLMELSSFLRAFIRTLKPVDRIEW